MKDIIIPTTETEEGKDPVYKLEDKDYLLIKTLRELTEAIDKLRIAMNG